MEKYQFTEEQRALMEGMQMPFAIYQFIDKRVVTLVLSDGFCDLFGYDDRDVAYYDMDNDMYKDTHPDDAARIAEEAVRFATEGGIYEAIYRTRMKDSADYLIVHAMGKHVYTHDGVRLAHVWYTDEGAYEEGANRRGTELNQALTETLREESLARASTYDHLTGLPSMTYFFELAEAGREAILKKGGHPALLFLDLNGMKFFNARYGFAEGNNLLRAFAKVLANTFSNENCCHISGDHFAVFTKEEGLEETLEQFFQDCSLMNGGNSLPVRVGIYLDSMEMVRVSIAYDRAKFARDSLRDSYGSCFAYFDQNLRDEKEHRQYILANFDKALEESQIVVHYQPIIRAVNGKICADEALSRWVDPVKGLLSPADFIPALEEAGLIYKLDLHLVDKALEKIARQEHAGFRAFTHSINLSRSDFDACDIVEEIRKRVDAAGVSHDLLAIEITESIIGTDFEFIKEQIMRFQDLGFPVWIDDFGSGYSSLDVLQSIKFDLIKFDMLFMRRLDENENSKIILTELMKMATALGVDTICEGVETEAQMRFLQEIGCSKLQGFYFQKPLPLSEILRRYKNGMQIGYEDPDEANYYEAIGRVNLYDLAVLGSDEEDALQNFFNTLPMGIIEVMGDETRFVRSNQSYRDFIQRFFGIDLSDETGSYATMPFGNGSSFMGLIKQCCEHDSRAFFDEQMADGSMLHSFVRRIAVNETAGKTALAIVVLSISSPDQGATYANIAQAVAADYYNLDRTDA